MVEDRPEDRPEDRAAARPGERRDLVALNMRDAPPDDPGEVMSALPHAREIGMRLHRAVGGKALLSVPYDERLVGDPDSGVLHGGVITALLDTACGSAVMSMPSRLSGTATLDLRIDYMRPASVGQTVRAAAECYRMTRSIGFARAVAYHDDPADPIASAAAAFMLERPKG
ncbi:MAG TPA: PaaI family thioesterase [Paracoccaceae bacterium]|nr:PaaI family thioesterase [Paracoccaceae bacterium]